MPKQRSSKSKAEKKGTKVTEEIRGETGRMGDIGTYSGPKAPAERDRSAERPGADRAARGQGGRQQ